MTVRTSVLALLVAVTASAAYFFTAANTVPATHVGQQQFTINAMALEPSACSGIIITNPTVVTNGVGTLGNDLILADASGMTLNGNGGQDCMIGGLGADIFKGNGKTAGDVCIGNGGTDTNFSGKCQFFTQ